MNRMTKASVLFLMLGATAATAQGTLPVQLTACLQITGLLQRLACYDGVAHSVSPSPLLRTAPAQRPVAQSLPPAANATLPAYIAPPIPAAPPTGLGSERLPRTASAAPRRAQELSAAIASVSYDARRRFTITLDNGQVWRQLEGDTGILQAPGNANVRISRGALGSYDLNIVGRNATYRVSRLQ
jgi:hypothetical protein